ncbi:MAG: 2-phosphosulfolactate phosphatase, partial [Nocardioides sp.]
MTDGRAAAHGQRAYGVRLEWGPTGAAAVAVGADIAVVVDVLSFTTTLSVAVEHGIRVFPYSWKDHRAQAYADERDAVLAVGRFEARSAAAAVSLSPTQMAHADGPERIVLPSPNGSAISFALATSGLTVVGACLRNRSAVGRWLAPQVAAGARLAVVAAGERWPDGSLRP